MRLKSSKKTWSRGAARQLKARQLGQATVRLKKNTAVKIQDLLLDGFSLFFDFCRAGLAREAGTSNSDTTATPEKKLGKKRLILIIQESSMRFHGAGLQQKCDAVGAV